ncbi:hypothetical protein EJB05_40925, partial [Eragrostis curvula]
MAPSFGRSISFPLSPARSAKRHIRSISLPCRSHPLLAHLHSHIAAVRSWAADPTTAAPSAGLAHIDALHGALGELLVMLPEAQNAASDRLLDAFVLLADAHRGFQETLLALKADVADVQAALRRRDAARLASAARSQRKNDKELARLAATVAAKCARLINGTTTATAEEAALMDAVAASAAASAAVFSAAASMSASVSSSSSKKTSAFAAFTKKDTSSEMAEVAPEKLEELAQCIDDCENGSEKVFRTIIRTRVSLLNIRTPAI